jgi:hypothetical protein
MRPASWFARFPWLGLLPLVASCVGRIGDADQRPGGDSIPGDSLAVAPSKISRLTRIEYERTVTAIFGAELLTGVRFDNLPSDSKAGPFESNAPLDVDEDGVDGYRNVAEAIGERAGADAEALLGCEESSACVEGFVQDLGDKLYRRPLDAEAQAAYLKLFEAIRNSGTLSDALRVTVTAMLQSPQFLYRLELGTETSEPDVRRLTGYELAARLSFFLWKTAPDAELIAAAGAGDLDEPEGIEREARRLLTDPRADYTIGRFHLAWLGVAELEEHALDTEAFPDFEALKADMLAETEQFVVDVFHHDAKLETLLSAPYTFASPALAAFYGSAEPDADGKLALDTDQRLGVLTHASFLTAHAKSPKTAAIHRGKAIREQLFCQGLPAPPPVDTIIEPDPSLTTREQIEQKTAPETCAACHTLINPLGFLFENYDAIGRWRTEDNGLPVDASGGISETDVDGDLVGAVELAQALASSETVTSCVSRQWLRFALGRDDGKLDTESIELASERAHQQSGDLRELIVGLTISDAFRHRRVPKLD